MRKLMEGTASNFLDLAPKGVPRAKVYAFHSAKGRIPHLPAPTFRSIKREAIAFLGAAGEARKSKIKRIYFVPAFIPVIPLTVISELPKPAKEDLNEIAETLQRIYRLKMKPIVAPPIPWEEAPRFLEEFYKGIEKREMKT